jgi:hypothetical protein
MKGSRAPLVELNGAREPFMGKAHVRLSPPEEAHVRPPQTGDASSTLLLTAHVLGATASCGVKCAHVRPSHVVHWLWSPGTPVSPVVQKIKLFRQNKEGLNFFQFVRAAVNAA